MGQSGRSDRAPADERSARSPLRKKRPETKKSPHGSFGRVGLRQVPTRDRERSTDRVPGTGKGSEMQARESIVVGTDGTETAERAVDRAGAIALAFGATVHVVSAYSDDKTPLVGAGRQGDRARAQQHVDRAQERLAKQGVESEAHLSNREAGRALVAIADEHHANMIVVGNRGMSGAKHVLGSVPNYVSHHADCDVVIVRTT